MQLQGEKKLEAWFISPANREYSCVDPTTFQSVNKFTKNLPTRTAGKGLTTAKYVFFIGAAIKIAVY